MKVLAIIPINKGAQTNSTTVTGEAASLALSTEVLCVGCYLQQALQQTAITLLGTGLTGETGAQLDS